MLVLRSRLFSIIAIVTTFLATPVVAQDGFSAPSSVKVDVCSGEVKVLSQQQEGQQLAIEVEIAIAGCDGVCTGTLEYALLLADANGNDIQWQLADSWNWRDVKAPFKLTLKSQALPNSTLKEVRSIKLGRCSCSTVKE